MCETSTPPLPRPVGTWSVEARIAMALERIAAALEGPAVQPSAAPVPQGCADGHHAEKYRVTFGCDDEWECSRLKGGCGYRSPALVGTGV